MKQTSQAVWQKLLFMKQRLIIIIIGVVLALAGCDGGKAVRQITNLGDTPYQQDTILVTYATNPERALTLLDSALLLGNISEYRGQYICNEAGDEREINKNTGFRRRG